MRKNKGMVIIAVLLVAALAGWWWWRSPSSQTAKDEAAEKLTPELSMASMSISDIDSEHIKIKSKITISNPLPVDINTSRLYYEVYVDSVKVIEDAYEKPIRIASSDSTVIELPMELLAKPMARALKYFNDNKIDSADYSVKANFQVDIPIAGERSFDMNLSKRLSALRLPKINVKDVDLHAFSLKDKGVDMVVQVINPNQFPMKLKDGAFSFAIEDDLKMEGVVEKTVNIPAHGSQDISMHAAVMDGKVIKGSWKLLTDKKGTRFDLLFKGKLLSENEMLNNSNMAMKMNGTLDEMLKAVKVTKENIKE